VNVTELAEQVLDACRSRGYLVSTAESCTGGLVVGGLTAIAGSSDVVDCGFVVYSNQAKQTLLSVSPLTLELYGAVSEAVAKEMAEGALSGSRATIAVSTTGVAGPGGSEHKPEGMVCFGLAKNGAATKVETVQFGAIGRENVRHLAVKHAMNMVLDAAKH
jgi:nicotinamide-nucleotide amidase